MASFRADSIDPKRMRKGLEKPPPPDCRDYLDMDTDEEEFGRQETPEPDEELPPEPEKPTFTDAEMEILVNYVKDLTILPSEVESIDFMTLEWIQEYFYNPAHTILTIFFDGTECRALLDFPLQTDQGLTYFLRSPWQVYTPENFLSTVIFGNLSGDLEHSMLKFLEIMYSPVAVHSNEWPEVMRDQIFSDLNQFLMKLTDATYGPMNLTILYIPREGIKDEKSVSPVNKDRGQEGFIERLERVARYWIKQIKGALEGTDLPPRPTCRTITDEIDFWKYRFENLSCLHHQLNSDSVLAIVKILEDANSSSVQRFYSLSAKVDDVAAESSSNVTYLNLFVEHCTDFEVPAGIEEYSLKILHLIRFVGLESKFYTSKDKIDTLCRALGTQIIEQCKKYINMDTVLNGDTSEGKKMLENSINCCQAFIHMFERLSRTDAASGTPVISSVNKLTAFSHVNIFIQRCQDLIEISDARFVYDTCEEVKMIGGTKGMEHEVQYQKIEHSFSEILDEVKDIHESILDVTANTWLNQMASFNKKIQDIDNMVKNLILEIFKDVQNIEESIDALYAMKRFATRKHLLETIRNHWMFVWKIFECELETIDIREEDSLYDIATTRNAGVATLLRIKTQYLTSQFNMMINASDWLGDSNVQECIIAKYKQIQNALSKSESSFFSLWEKDVQSDADIRNILKAPVLAFLDHPNEVFLTVNMDESYLQNMREIIEWKYLKYDSKSMNSKFLQKWQPIKSRYVRIQFLCELYNSIIRQLEKKERALLENAINDVRNCILPLLPKCSWAVENIDKIYGEWFKNILLFKDVVTVFKTTNAHIRSSCEVIRNSQLIRATNNVAYTVKQFEEYLDCIKTENLSVIKKSSKSIVADLYALHRKAKYGETTPRHWIMYVNEIIQTFENSLIANIRASLIASLQFFNRDSKTNSEPLLHVDVNLSDDNQIMLIPDINDIKDTLGKIIRSTDEILYSTDEFHRIRNFGRSSQENDKTIRLNDDVNDLRKIIENEITSGLEEISAFQISIVKVENIAKIDEVLKAIGQDTHEEREQLEDAIRWCEEILDMVNNLEQIIRLKFISLNTQNLKRKVLTECENIKETLFVELSKFIASELTLERMPAQT